MIFDSVVNTLEPEVYEAVEELFKHCIKKEQNPNEFLIYLVNGHYDPIQLEGYSPYMIGLGEGIKDMDRLRFLEVYLSLDFEKYYNEATERHRKFELRTESLSLEMMIYVHFWESKVILRRYNQLALLADSNEYDWHLSPRPKETYDFFVKDIRDVFQRNNLKIYSILKRAYRSQIRNAFAHSDYYFSDEKIYLENYDPSNRWTVEYISFSDFEEMLVLTVLLHHCTVDLTEKYSKIYGHENPSRLINVPDANPKPSKRIEYQETGDHYDWYWDSQLRH